MKVKLFFLTLLCAISFGYAQTTYVPDDNFENYLETHDESGSIVTIGDSTSMGNGVVNDDYVLTVNISTVQVLDVSNLGISDLTGIEDFTNLSSLDCSFNLLTNVNVRQNTNLIYLFCQNNDIIQIDLSQNQYLADLYCQNNQIEALELQHNNGLFQLRCDNNQLKVLNIQNGNNNYNSSTFGAFSINTLNNPDLECIQVDDPTFSTNNWSDIDATSSFSTGCNYTVYVPDDNFETYLETHNANGIAVPFGDLSNMGNATTFYQNLDNSVYRYKIEHITHLDVTNKNIADLTGINSFDALESLICADNQLSLLDLRKNTLLTYLDCNTNSLIELDVRNYNNTNFTYFNSTNTPNLTCISVDDANYSTNNWTNINVTNSFGEHCFETYVPDDNFEYFLETHGNSQFISLPNFSFWEHQLLSIGSPGSFGNGVMDDYVRTDKVIAENKLFIYNLDIVDLTGIEDFSNLIQLSAGYNLLTDLDFSNNLLLESLSVERNQINNLNITQNTALSVLDCGNNQLSSLDYTSNSNLRILNVYDNFLTELDVSLHTNLESLACQNNNLTELNVKNGNNQNFYPYFGFNSVNNPNLSCIQVDDAAYSTANWTSIDSQSYFSIDCGYIFETYVPDDNFENYLETHNAQGLAVAFGDPTSMGNQIANDDYVTTASIDTVTMLSVYNLYIADATGLEDFELLEDLNFSENILTSLDVSQNLQLTKLNCSRNSLTNLDLTNNILLTELYSSDHQMITIDLSQNNFLTIINLGNGELTSLDLSQNTLLTTLYCWNNFITGLDLSTHNQLSKLKCQNNRLNQLNVQNGNNQNVTEFDITDNVDLLCVQVDEQQYSEDYWFDKDRDTYYDNNCGYLGITENNKITYSFYPNPVKDELTISTQNKAIFSMINVNGQIVKQGSLESGENKISTSSLSNGFYIIKITIEGKTFANKVYKK